MELCKTLAKGLKLYLRRYSNREDVNWIEGSNGISRTMDPRDRLEEVDKVKRR